MSVETLDHTFEMRLLTDAELNDVNGGFLVEGFIAFLVGFIIGGGTGGGQYPGDVYWPAA